MNFYIRPIWDDEAKIYYSDSNIIGLHLEARSIDELFAIADEVAIDLVLANHISQDDIFAKPLKEMISTMCYDGRNNAMENRASV